MPSCGLSLGSLAGPPDSPYPPPCVWTCGSAVVLVKLLPAPLLKVHLSQPGCDLVQATVLLSLSFLLPSVKVLHTEALLGGEGV